MPEQSHSEFHRAAASPGLEPDAVIERLLDLAERSTSESEFYRVLVRDLVEATAGLGAAVWTAEADGLRLAAQHQLMHSSRPGGAHVNRLEETTRGGDCLTFRELDSDVDAVVILCPWRTAEEVFGVLELRQSGRISEPALAGQVRFLRVAADLVASFHRNRRLVTLKNREDQWRQIDRFSLAVHGSSDLETTAFGVANEGRRLIGCDRLTVVVRRRGRWRAVAVSGSDRVNRRSPVVAQLEFLAGLVATQRRGVWSGQDREELPPELEGPLDDYQDASSARLVALLPLSPVLEDAESDDPVEAEPFAVLVVEQFTQTGGRALRELCEAVCRHSSSALERALQFEEMPLRRLSCLLDRSRWVKRVQRQPWTVVIAATLVILVLLMAAIPADLRVEATGTLEPREKRHLFAPTDGLVERLLVREAGQHVHANEELILLRDPQLDFEAERVLGDLETARKKLAGIEAERLHADRTSRSDLRDAALRSADEQALKKQIEGLERQQAILVERRAQLSLRSPMEGRVLTWDVEELLQSRPVARGQVLLTVADLKGDWIVELEIPDDRIADVTGAMQVQKSPLETRFILATAPETRYLGQIEEISPATDVRGGGKPTVAAIVCPEDQEAMRTLRPGASVVVKIDCGRHSLLYVLLRGVLRAVRSRILF